MHLIDNILSTENNIPKPNLFQDPRFKICQQQAEKPIVYPPTGKELQEKNTTELQASR